MCGDWILASGDSILAFAEWIVESGDSILVCGEWIMASGEWLKTLICLYFQWKTEIWGSPGKMFRIQGLWR